jgi:hypothetical protein
MFYTFERNPNPIFPKIIGVVLKNTIVLIDGLSCGYNNLDNMVTMKENSVRHVHSGEIEVIYK